MISNIDQIQSELIIKTKFTEKIRFQHHRKYRQKYGEEKKGRVWFHK